MVARRLRCFALAYVCLAPLAAGKIYSNTWAFVAVDESAGVGTCWGHSHYGGSCGSVDFNGVTDVYSNGEAFLALNKDAGIGTCWGLSSSGGSCGSVDFNGVTDVYGTHIAFLALNKNAGIGICWGHGGYGGSCGSVDFNGVTDVYSTEGAFLALNKNTGIGTCWGVSQYGGSCGSVDFNGVTDVYSTRRAFLAFNKNAGFGTCWGESVRGGSCGSVDFNGVTDVYSTQWAFLAWNKNSGSGTCWGNSQYGGSCGSVDFDGVTDVYPNGNAFLALNKNAGIGTCWGDSNLGGSCGSVDFNGVTHVYSNLLAFLAFNKNAGIWTCWGDSGSGGSCGSFDLNGVTDVYGTLGAFLALNKNSGKGTCWGDINSGGSCAGIDFEYTIPTLTSSTSATSKTTTTSLTASTLSLTDSSTSSTTISTTTTTTRSGTTTASTWSETSTATVSSTTTTFSWSSTNTISTHTHTNITTSMTTSMTTASQTLTASSTSSTTATTTSTVSVTTSETSASLTVTTFSNSSTTVSTTSTVSVTASKTSASSTVTTFSNSSTTVSTRSTASRPVPLPNSSTTAPPQLPQLPFPMSDVLNTLNSSLTTHAIVKTLSRPYLTSTHAYTFMDTGTSTTTMSSTWSTSMALLTAGANVITPLLSSSTSSSDGARTGRHTSRNAVGWCMGPLAVADGWCKHISQEEICIAIKQCTWVLPQRKVCSGPGRNSTGWCSHVPTEFCEKVKQCKLVYQVEKRLRAQAVMQVTALAEKSLRARLVENATYHAGLKQSEPMSAQQVTSVGVVTVVLFTPAVAHASGAGVTLNAAGQNGSDAATVMLPTSLLLHALAGANGSGQVSIALTALSSESASQLGIAEGAGPALASQPVSISLYGEMGDELKIENLVEPVQVLFQSVATEGAKCAYWDEASSAWSDKGMTRVSDASMPNALICNTSHLTIFGAVVGEFISAFEDMASVLICSNARALLSAKAFSSLINSSRWQHSLPAGLLWASLALSFLAIAIARVGDLMTKHDLPDQDRLLMAENSHIPNAGEQDNASRARPTLATKRLCSRCFSLVTKVLYWMGLLPNLVIMILEGHLSLGELPQAFIGSSIKRIQAFRANVDELTLDFVAKANAADATTSVQARPSYRRALTKLSDETRGGNALSAAQAFLEAGCLRRAFLTLQAVHPWTTLRHLSAFSSHTARTAIFILRFFICMTAAVIFYDASGTTLSPDADPQCTPRAGFFSELVRATTVGVASDVVASRIAEMLEKLRRRHVINKGEWSIAARRWQHLVWHLKADLFWLLWFGCLMFCTLLIAVFLANVDEASTSAWFQSTAVTFLDAWVVYPLVFAASVALSTSILLRCRPGLEEELLPSGAGTGSDRQAFEDDVLELPTLMAAPKQQNKFCEDIVAVEEIQDNPSRPQTLSSVMPA